MYVLAETSAGRIAGLQSGPTVVFRGVPYGASTAGRGRFRAPRSPEGWRGVRECVGHGPASPQPAVDPRYAYARLVTFDQALANGGMGEDCLRLNLWTPGLEPEAKRPVMVCIHGGGFTNGSGALPLFDGAELAARGDVVVVAVTHRLNVFGYVDLEAAGVRGEVADAGTAGLLDLVEALRWVREHADRFGGDPQRVTVFGQSGGGWKISALLAMPAARGLFHRAVIQSGSRLTLPTREEAGAVAARLIAELGVAPEAGALAEPPMEAVLDAAMRVGLPLFEPVVGGPNLPKQPVDALADTADVPLIVSTVLDDASFLSVQFDLTEAQLGALLEQRYGDAAAAMHRLYRDARPGKAPFLLLGEIITDAGFRRYAHVQAETRAAAAGAPVHVYQWRWPTPAFDGVYGAAHTTDVPASLHNLHDPLLVGAVGKARPLAGFLSSALVGFARGGDPSVEGAPVWPRFTSDRRSTVLIGDDVGVVDDPDRELREFWTRMPPTPTVFG